MQVQPFLQVYLTYEEKVFLIQRLGNCWLPIGGHLVLRGAEPSNLGSVKSELDFMMEKINSAAPGASYSLYGSEGGLYLTRPYRGPYKIKAANANYGSVYFGRFESEPPIVEGAFELFSLDRLKSMQVGFHLGHLVLENSELALRPKDLVALRRLDPTTN